VSGVLTYYNDSNTSQIVQVPVTTLTPVSQWNPTIFELNITPSGLNTTYTAQLVLNLSIGSTHYPINVTSQSLTFTYQKDTSGDGLADSEKARGWVIPLWSVPGGWVMPSTADNPGNTSWVWANANDYATNGLVSDYVEKEYDLDPNTVDTAGSHMLDSWNLTFNLGNRAIPNASDFIVTYENYSSTPYDPFAAGLAYAPGEVGTGSVFAANISNISSSSAHGIYSGDGSSWAAHVLWNYAALSTFVNLSGVRDSDTLRATEGKWGSFKTLTVWGKLSFGANPIEKSSLANGISDGLRLRPTATEDLTLNITNLYLKGASSGAGYAAEFELFAGSTPTGIPELTNYSEPVGASGDPTRLTAYTVAIPVSQLSPNQTLQLQVILNNSNTSVLTPVVFNSGQYEANITYDLFKGVPLPETFTSTAKNGLNASLTMTLGTVLAGEKAPTYLWVPTTNSTLNGLPYGLERYTGEQSFDLVVVNVSANLVSNWVPDPWNLSADHGYKLSLRAGLNNLLIPREQFLMSPLGEAIMGGESFSYLTGHPTPPILSTDSSAQTILNQSFRGSQGLMVALQAYWQNRSFASGTGSFSAEELGVSNTSSSQIRTVAVTSPPPNNTGGLPADPILFNSSDATAALQSVLTLNVTSAATIDLLLAGLLDNNTGGINGTFLNVTSEVHILGLAGPVLNGLANSSLYTQGLYGIPKWRAPPPTPSGGGFLGDFFNSVISVLTNPSGLILAIVGLVLFGPLFDMIFFNHILSEALALGGVLVARTEGAIATVASALLSDLDILRAFIILGVTVLLDKVFSPVTNVLNQYCTTLNTSFAQGRGDVAGSPGFVTAAHRTEFWNALDGSAFVGMVGISAVSAIALTLVAPFSLGTGFLVPLIMNILIGTVFTGTVSFGTSGLSQYSQVGPPFVTSLDNQVKGLGWPIAADTTGFTTLFDEVNITLGLLGFFLAVAAAALSTKLTPWLGVASTAIGVLALILDNYDYTHHTSNLDVVALMCSGISFCLAAVGLGEDTSWLVGLINYVGFVLGGAGLFLYL
jgi:hypothetical protein